MGKENFLSDYVQVNDRIEAFYKKYPEGSIQTELLSWENGIVMMKAYAYRNQDDKRPSTGHAYEREDSSYINKTSALENCETSAVGRALAMMGFEIKKSVASREEVQNAKHQQEKLGLVNSAPLDKAKIEALKQRAAEKKVGLDYICGVKKVNSVEELTFEMWQNAMAWLEKK